MPESFSTKKNSWSKNGDWTKKLIRDTSKSRGGHVELGETLEGALRREMKEELGISVEKASLVQKSFATATNGERGRIHYFHIEKWKGRIRSYEAERVYWESEISNLSILPDRKAVRTLLKQGNTDSF